MKKFLTSLMFGFVLSSCIYSPSDEPFTDVKPPANNGYVSLSGITGGEPFAIYNKTNFSFTASPAGKKYYHIAVYLDDKHVYTSESGGNTFYFEFDPAKYENGTHTLHVDITYASGTGSLADIAGVEMVSFEQNWPVIIDLVPPEPVTNLSVTIEDGKLMLKWPPPSKKNFLSYRITRNYLNEGGSIVNSEVITVASNNLVTYHDTFYVGGDVQYRVDIIGYTFEVNGTLSLFDCNPIDISFVESYLTPYFEFQRPLLYNNNDIKIAWYNPYLFSSRSISIASKVDIPNLKFGETRQIEASVERKVDGINKHRYKMIMNAYLGKITPVWSNFISYSESLQSYFLGSGQYIYRINETSMEVTDKLVLPNNGELIVSPSANHAYVMYADRKMFSAIDLETLTITETFNMSDVLAFSIGSYQRQVGFRFGLTDNNYFYCDSFDNQVFVADLSERTTIWHKDNASDNKVTLSPDSEWLIYGSKIHKKSGNGISVSYPEHALLGSYDNSTKVVFIQDNHFVVNDLTNMKAYDPNSTPNIVNRLVPYFSASRINLDYPIYDPDSGTLSSGDYTNSGYEFNVYSSLDFSLIKTMDIVATNAVTTQFRNGIYFHRDGYYLQLQ